VVEREVFEGTESRDGGSREREEIRCSALVVLVILALILMLMLALIVLFRDTNQR
jgi:hypothetical protein